MSDEAISWTEGLAQSWLFDHGWSYTIAPQEWRANVLPAAYRFVATLHIMTIFKRVFKCDGSLELPLWLYFCLAHQLFFGFDYAFNVKC